ncbi:MAG TPA: hypothetical protein VFI31_07270 [Pirellulales bacterium]|nr:hypothetical protein [Pirellulales bacterium]
MSVQRFGRLIWAGPQYYFNDCLFTLFHLSPCLSLCCCALLATIADGSESSSKDGEAVLQLALSARTGLVSGSVEIDGRQWYPGGELKESITLIFDLGGRKVSYSYKGTGPGYPIHFLRNQNESLLYVEGTYVVTRDLPDKRYEIPNGTPIDPRIAGFSTWHGVSTRITLESVAESFKTQPIEKAIKEPDGRWRIEWLLNKQENEQGRKTIWFDPQFGCAPTAMKMQLEHLHGEVIGEADLWVDVRVEYSLVGDVAVPVRWVLDDLYGSRVGFDWRLVWNGVNEPIDDSVFEMASMKLPNGTVIENKRFSKPVIEGIVGKVTDLPKPARKRRWMPYFIAANVCALVILVALGYRSRRRQHA